MDYGSLIRQAWRFTWRFKFLWVFGLFAPSTVGSCSSGSPGGGSYSLGGGPEGVPPDLERGVGDVGNWLARNLDIIIMLAVLAALVGLAVFVVSFIAQGAMARGTADVALGRHTSLGELWSVGLGLAFRYFLLFLLMIGLGIVVALVIGGLVIVGVLSGSQLSGSAQVAFIIVAVLVGLLLGLALLVVSIALGVALAFTQRAIAIEDVGPVQGLKMGLGLLRDHPGTAALVWLISLALGIGAGLALFLLVVVLMIPLGGLAALLFVGLGASPVSIGYTVLAALLLILGGWLLSAIVNTFFWHYWTLVYLNFTGRLANGLEVQGA